MYECIKNSGLEYYSLYGKSSNIFLFPTENNYFSKETRIKLQSLSHED